MLSTFRYVAAALVGVLWAQTPVQAHEQAVGLTEITLHAAEGEGVACLLQVCRLEVAHRLSIHDAESTLMAVLGARADLVGDRAAQAQFEAYVASRFSVSDAGSGQAVPLTLLGGEVERGYYWIYQEGLIPAGVSELTISQGVLMDVIPQQTNRVNIKLGDDVATLIFSGTPGPQGFSLP